ncbi:uncharacterized mitochondrial protein AtMg00810-like [Telopea speciosissima]|uniref:uncharacterized mitochondrial protein AtMg00810-like n=1 Tax=Telopea speciosissima TaxID=54955 RepID=UPI001CC62C9D|nr:uncharacterized mitochondrial protein AtMg00810-like [Telopea speciosissima]
MSQPPGFVDASQPNAVCRLNRALYGLCQAPRAWFDRFSMFLLECGFVCSTYDSSMFVYRSQGRVMILLLYVDDIVTLGTTFAMKDLGPLHYFLGIEVTSTPQGLFLSQAKYATDILHRAHIVDIKPTCTPMAIRPDLASTDPFKDVTLYRSLVGALQYLTMTRPNLSYAVNSVCQHMHAPTMAHFGMVKRILRYVRGTLDQGLRIIGRAVQLQGGPQQVFVPSLGPNCISWSAKKQPTIARSSTEAEYWAMASTTAELLG